MAASLSAAIQAISKSLEAQYDSIFAHAGNVGDSREDRLCTGKATLRLSPEGVRRLRLLPAAVARMAAATAGAPDEEGWVIAEIPTESINHAMSDVLKLGAEAEVVAPPEFRRRMGETAARLAAIYANAPAP